MRHLLANIVTYSIAAILLALAALFAWARAAQLALTNEATVLARYEPTPVHEFEWEDLGRSSYRRNCANCHGREGGGWDQYPGLSHTAALVAAEGGREFVVDLHLYGLTSRRWGAPMPPMGHLHDVELAAVLNYVLVRFSPRAQLEAASPLYLPRDVAARRTQGLSSAEVNARRPFPERYPR
jgi:mono/diheme cytochrome c family protein